MPVLYCTVGLPGSGKSTTARQMADAPDVEEVSKDDLRDRPDAPPDFRARERWVVRERDRIVSEALAAGRSIVVHDTNLNPVHPRRLAALAGQHGAKFEILDFTHVSVEECIRRDALRTASVGESVIRGMYEQYLA
jgi:predicted kinase